MAKRYFDPERFTEKRATRTEDLVTGEVQHRPDGRITRVTYGPFRDRAKAEEVASGLSRKRGCIRSEIQELKFPDPLHDWR